MNRVLRSKRDRYLKVADAFIIKIKNFTDILEECEVLESDSIETIIFKKYIELNELTKVADYINDKGYRIKTSSYIGERKYISNDISEVINNPSTNVNISLINAIKEMKELDRLLIKMNANRLIHFDKHE